MVKRLLSSIVNLNYPKDKLEIQVLDDSTDETTTLVSKLIREYQSQDFNILHIQRSNRKGFKAGALQYGTSMARGEYIVIFDADFLPKSDFILASLPYFVDSKVGVVQSRWGHINQEYSFLTEVQAFQLNVHFTIEQAGRQAGGLYLQFNGTAGIWRKSCILDAGGWHADTLTEDLDLSIRAQLKKWKIAYLEDNVAPAELPSEIGGLKSQQYRWMKGGAETARKLLPTLWKSNIGLYQKIHGTSHLLASSVYLAIFVLGVLSVPLGILMDPSDIKLRYYGIFLISLIAIVMVYYVANVERSWKGSSKIKLVLKFIFIFPLFLSLSMGLSLHNAIAVLQGWIGKKTAFVRTPKFDMVQKLRANDIQNYKMMPLTTITLLEGTLFLYFIGSMIYSLHSGHTSFLSLQILLTMGYGLIFLLSVKEWLYKKTQL